MRTSAFLVVSVSVSLLAVSADADQGGHSRRPIEITARGMQRPAETMVTKVFVLRHYPAGRLVNILDTVTRDSRYALDEVSNRLIVTGPVSELEEIATLIEALDVQKVQAVESRPMVCRAYMFELASPSSAMRRFHIEATGSDPLSPEQVLKVSDGTQLKAERFLQESPKDTVEWIFDIEGRAASSEAIQRLVAQIPNCQLMQLEWSEHTPVMPTTKVPPLPDSLQKHIDRFLGPGAGIVGYWFGSMSVPGTVRAPIGPEWTFNFEVQPSGQEGQLMLDLAVTEMRDNDMWEIISNRIQGKVGRPVIVGYSRDSHGVQTTGALVVIPEVVTGLD